nr:Coenzyme F420 hydrogenase/dehydrogenase, beta subunit C-terminal domain [Bacteroidales bacterium]
FLVRICVFVERIHEFSLLLTIVLKMNNDEVIKKLKKVIRHHNCVGCGACTLFSNQTSRMIRTPMGPIPDLQNAVFSEDALTVCPGIGISYPDLYDDHYGSRPENYLYGKIQQVRIGFSGTDKLRQKGASGGIITSVLTHLLEEKIVSGVVCVKQGIPLPLEASSVIARTKEELIDSMQSVYIPVSVLDIISEFKEGESYAMVCLPEQSAALRKLQSMGHEGALQVKYVLGPYTGTALYPSAINSFLRSKRIAKNDEVTSLKWREGEWPGYLEIKTKSGKVLQSKKIYYNFLIPFFITHTSLRSMDFVNEFADLSVGDAWSPKYESEGKGFSVFVTRTKEMEEIVSQMIRRNLIQADVVPDSESIAMHGHMLDFKKRGGYIRNRMRAFFGYSIPEYGYKPAKIAFSRKLTELVISSIFLLAGTKISHGLMRVIPEKVLGPAFDFMRLKWKNISKPTKRKGLSSYEIIITKN